MSSSKTPVTKDLLGSSSTGSSKIKVMYVRGDDEKSSPNKSRNQASKSRFEGHGKAGNPRHKDTRPKFEDDSYERSPWRTVSRAPNAEPTEDHRGITGNSVVDPEQIRRQRLEETRVYGENACKALFESRPESIVRAWFVQSVTPRFRDALKFMAANRKAYHVVDDKELAKASGTDHHGGVCFLIKKRGGLNVETYLETAPEKDCVLALEQVSNPHNLGAMMRSAAHFGVKGVLLQDVAMLESGAAVRTAEGGAEHIKGLTDESFVSGLDKFRDAGYTIVTTSSHKGSKTLAQTELPKKVVFVLGQEGDGLSDATWQQGDLRVAIGGTGNVESLNVSVATGILLADWWRQSEME